MDKFVNKKIETYVAGFKNDIRAKAANIGVSNADDKLNELMEFVMEYPRLIIEKDDLLRRKRVKTVIPAINRCVAKIFNGEQCTRRKKDGCEFCGTHSKGMPHGTMGDCEVSFAADANLQSFDVVAEDIGGIVYYIDAENNVFKTEDIMQNKKNPAIIAKAIRVGGKLSIPEFDVFG